MMTQPDKKDVKAAMHKERHADGSASNHKARLCCHGRQQQWNVNFYETHAPVVGWTSVRTMLLMTKLYNLNTRSIYCALSYPWAEIRSVIYLHPPAGVIINNNGQDLVLKLKKNLDGLKDAGRIWWEYLFSGLEQMGFKQCVADQCIWKRYVIIIIVYVDDCLVFVNDKEKVDTLVLDISKQFEITDEGETIE
eukprot:2881390-Ditylum_brightwellii.AAC.1